MMCVCGVKRQSVWWVKDSVVKASAPSLTFALVLIAGRSHDKVDSDDFVQKSVANNTSLERTPLVRWDHRVSILLQAIFKRMLVLMATTVGVSIPRLQPFCPMVQLLQWWYHRLTKRDLLTTLQGNDSASEPLQRQQNQHISHNWTPHWQPREQVVMLRSKCVDSLFLKLLLVEEPLVKCRTG